MSALLLSPPALLQLQDLCYKCSGVRDLDTAATSFGSHDLAQLKYIGVFVSCRRSPTIIIMTLLFTIMMTIILIMLIAIISVIFISGTRW